MKEKTIKTHINMSNDTELITMSEGSNSIRISDVGKKNLKKSLLILGVLNLNA